MRNLALLTIIAGSIFLGGCGLSSRLKVGKTEQGEVVEAEGLAPHDVSDLINTKRSSLVDAQRNAVEKAVGVFVSAKTFVEQAIAIENDILAKTEGYIKKYEIMSETMDGGFYKTRIRALVALKDLEADLRENDLLQASEIKRPRVTVDIAEPTSAASLEKVLREAGYTVLDGDRANEAEILVQGKVEAFPFQSSGLGGFVSYRARMTLKAVRTSAKDVVLSLSREASGLGGNNELAALKAYETVGELAGKEVAAELGKAASKSRSLLIFVEGVKSFDQVDRVRKHFISMPGVSDLSLRLYDEEMAQFEVQLGPKESPEELAVHLEKSKTFPLKVVEAKSQTIRLQME